MRRGRNNIFGAVETRCVRPCVTRVIGSQLDFKGCRSPSSAPTRARESANDRADSLVRLPLPLNENGYIWNASMRRETEIKDEEGAT